MTDRDKVIKGLETHIKPNSRCVGCPYPNNGLCGDQLYHDALAILKEQANEYENGFNDAMLGKQELMYEGIDGKWYKKDW